MEINMTVIGYVLYAGLGLSVLSFLMLVLAMFTKKEVEPMFDQAINDDFEDDDSEIYEDEDVELPKRKSLFSFGKKRSKQLDEEDYEILDDEDEDIYEKNEEEEDEYAKDFELSFREEESFPKKRAPFGNMNMDDYNDDNDDDGTFEELEIKKYSDEENESPYSRIDDGSLDEEDEMLKRIQQYRDKFKK